MRQTAKRGAKKIYTDTSHRFHCDMTRILLEHIKPDMPEDTLTAVEPFDFWEQQMETGMCACNEFLSVLVLLFVHR
jgi:hypothetical protein